MADDDDLSIEEFLSQIAQYRRNIFETPDEDKGSEEEANQLDEIESNEDEEVTEVGSELSAAADKLRLFPILSDEPSEGEEVVRWGERPIYVSEQIKENSYLRVIPWSIVNPTQMFVNLFEYWDALDKFQKDLQELMADLEELPEFKPQESMLAPGLILMAYCACAEGQTVEWYRAQIVTVQIDPFLEVHVRLLDFGGTCRIRNPLALCYMQRDILYEFPAQSIEIKLHMSGYDGKVVKNWKEEGSAKLIECMNGKTTIGVHFIRKIKHVDPIKDFVWGKDFVWVTNISVLADADKEAHSTKREDVDVVNDYMDEDIQREILRRRVRDRKMKRMPLPGLGSTTEEIQNFLPRAHNIFQISQNNLVDHGEFVGRVEGVLRGNEFVHFIAQKEDLGTSTAEEAEGSLG